MTFLSVNVNKFALIRNARDADLPNLYNISKKCIEYGADSKFTTESLAIIEPVTVKDPVIAISYEEEALNASID